MFTTNKEANSEGRDSQLVDLAAKAIYVDHFLKAESLLLKVIQNTPTNYLYQYEEGNKLVIKFWNQQEYNQYFNWQKKQGINQTIIWLKSAYPRAFYFLGFLKIKTKEYEKALSFLDQGLELEPTNPKFLFEKAKALVGLKLYEQALTIYNSINQIGPYVSKYDIAKSLQQRASVLLEMGDIEQAEATYHQSLGWDAHNEMTITKLKQIQESRESNLHTIDRGLTPNLTNLEGNQLYQSFLERNYLKEAQNLQSPGFAHIDKMKNRGNFLGILSLCILSVIVIVALFS